MITQLQWFFFISPTQLAVLIGRAIKRKRTLKNPRWGPKKKVQVPLRTHDDFRESRRNRARSLCRYTRIRAAAAAALAELLRNWVVRN